MAQEKTPLWEGRFCLSEEPWQNCFCLKYQNLICVNDVDGSLATPTLGLSCLVRIVTFMALGTYPVRVTKPRTQGDQGT
mgnify:FL=1